MTLSEAIGVDRGAWRLRPEQEIPARYRTLFAEKPGSLAHVAGSRRTKRIDNKQVSTFEDTFASFNGISVIKTESEGARRSLDDDDDVVELGEEEEEVEKDEQKLRPRKSERRECKLDFQIVDKLFV